MTAVDTTTTHPPAAVGPYTEAAHLYLAAGWTCILPLPAGQKHPPPQGFTGATGRDTSPDDVATWRANERGSGNIALRLPDGVVGIDVDHYGDKIGATQLEALEAEHGQLPATWSSTSRGNSAVGLGPSRIMFYRVPQDRYRTSLGSAIEVIQRHHRYAVVSPSQHPTTGAWYWWFSPAGLPIERVPRPDDLAVLPDAWIALLRDGATTEGPAPAARGVGEALLVEIQTDERAGTCGDVDAAMATARERLSGAAEGGRHDAMLGRAHHLVHLGAAGHLGAGRALRELEGLWASLTDGGREAELHRMCTTSAAKAATETGVRMRTRDPCSLFDGIDLAKVMARTSVFAAAADDDSDGSDTDGGDPDGSNTDGDDPDSVTTVQVVKVSNQPQAQRWLTHTLGSGGLSGLFVRGDELVHVAAEGESGYAPLTRDGAEHDGPAQIRRAGVALVAHLIDSHYDVVRFDARSKLHKPTLFPEAVVKRATSWTGAHPNLRPLRGVVHSPVVRADGSLLDEPGYDKATGLYHLPEPGVVVPAVPADPSQLQIADAVALLTRMIDGFPFVTPADRDNFLGLLLTPMLRALAPPPYKLGAIEAHQRGSGKTLLAGLIRTVHGGVFRAEMPEDDAELRKQISTILLSTTGAVVLIDNVSGELKSSTLSSLLTTDKWDDRKLGSMDTMISRPNDRLWLVTANNLTYGGDIPRRVVRCRIDPGVPRPEHRTGFAIADLDGWVRSRRGELLGALLTIVRAWVVAGQPVPTRTTSDGYARWVATVSGLLAHSGLGASFDAEATQVVLTDEESEWGVLLTALQREFGAAAWSARDVHDAIDVVPSMAVMPRAAGKARLAADDLPSQWCDGDRVSVSARSIGMWLRNRRGRWAGRLTVREAGTRGHAALWRIEGVDA